MADTTKPTIFKSKRVYFSHPMQSVQQLYYGVGETEIDSWQRQAICLFPMRHRPALRPNQPPIQREPGAAPSAKRCWGETDRSCTSSAEVKNEWNYASKPLHVSMTCKKESFNILIHVPCIFYYFVLWPTNAQLFHKLSQSYMLRHYCVILREHEINTLPSYTVL